MKILTLLAFGLLAPAVMAQDLLADRSVSLDKTYKLQLQPLRLDYKLDVAEWLKPKQPNFVLDFRLGGWRDPYRYIGSRRFDYREAFGGSFRSARTEIEFSTGSTEAGRTTSFGFGISW